LKRVCVKSEALYKDLDRELPRRVFLVLHERVVFAKSDGKGGAICSGCTTEELLNRAYMDFVAPESSAAQNARRQSQEDGRARCRTTKLGLLRGAQG